jgi:integrase
MSVKRRGDRWYYDFMIKRIRYRGAIPEARTKQQARDAEAAVRKSIFDGTYGRPSGTSSFIEYAEKVFLPWSKEYKRSTNDQYHIETFKGYFANKSFREITPMLIEKFKRERRQGITRYKIERKPASVNRELALLSKIFNMAIRDGLADTNPCEKVQKMREDNKRTRYLLPKEEKSLMAVLTGTRAHLWPVVLLAIYTGMRKGEILSLTWPQVDFMRNVIHLLITKSGKARSVPMNEPVRNELLNLKAESNGSEFVFVSVRTGRALGWIKRAFATACREAGIENLHFHDLRHTTSTRLADNGVDPFTIAQILGHSDLRMTARYTHATDHSLKRAVEGLVEYNQPERDCHKIVTNEKRKAS